MAIALHLHLAPLLQLQVISLSFPLLNMAQHCHFSSSALTAAPPSPWDLNCMCQYASGCSSDDDCCSGQICSNYLTWTQCTESRLFKDKASLPNPGCKATVTTLPLTADDFGCITDADCCNPSANCDPGGVCRFPETCSDSLDESDPGSRSPTVVPFGAPSVPTTPIPGVPSAAPIAVPVPPTPPTPPFSNYNPYIVTRNYYVNPSYQTSLQSSIATADGVAKEVMEVMLDISSAYWIDVKSKVTGSGTGTLEGILQDAASKPTKQLVTFMIYDLPNRDCHAKASNGEICCTYNADGTCNYLGGGDCSAGLREYERQYIDPIFGVLDRFDELVEIVLVIEPDSLPNLATNLDDPKCGNTATDNSYKHGISYAINKFQDLRVTMYLDAGHGGWLGWVDNMQLFTQLVLSMDFPISRLRGFATNVANYQPIGSMCPFQSADGLRNDYCLNGQHATDPCCADPCGLASEWNPANNEMNYAHLLRLAFEQGTGGAWNAHVIIDSGRNGVTSHRSSCANWCNARDAGVGLLPTVATARPDLVDAYFWLKTPGESDGCTQVLPSGGFCPRFDDFCASVDSIGYLAGEPRAPEAGHWFDYQIKQLASNAVWAGEIPPPDVPPPGSGSRSPTAVPFGAPSVPTTPIPGVPSAAPIAISVPPTPPTPISGYTALSTRGNQIIDAAGQNFRITGVNWYG